MFKRLFGKRSNETKPASAGIDMDAFVRQMTERDGSKDRADRLPAWALLLRSPLASGGDATSWFGGRPKVPVGFTWPRDPDGVALHFLAQIDISSLKEEPTTGRRPSGLSAEGAMLFFVGRTSSCHLFSAAEMTQASEMPPPDDLAPVSELGFFSEDAAFRYWPIDPVAYLDTGGGRPDFLPDRFKHPADWITNWGIAALEAELVIEHLERERTSGASFLKFLNERRAAGKAPSDADIVRLKTAQMMAARLPSLLTAMRAWRATAASRPQTDPVDAASLDNVFRMRMALADEMQHHSLNRIFAGNPKEVWTRIMREYQAPLGYGDHDRLPAALHPFIEAMITDWRGHRLFGLELPPPYNDEDLRGRDCLITVSGDRLLRTRVSRSRLRLPRKSPALEEPVRSQRERRRF